MVWKRSKVAWVRSWAEAASLASRVVSAASNSSCEIVLFSRRYCMSCACRERWCLHHESAL